MAFTCPNKNNREWRRLISKLGYKEAMSEYIKHGDIPNADNYDRRSSKDKKEFIVEDIQSMRKWFEDRFDGESFKVVKNLIDGDSFGQFYGNLVYLYEGAEQGTGYHEAFHKVSQLYLTSKQRKALYNEVRDKVKWVDDIGAEEILAEDFRQYMLTGQSNILGRPKATSIFSKIWRAIKNFVLGEIDAQTVYEKLASKRGYSGKKKVSTGFGLKLNRIAGFTEHESRLILGDFTAMFFSSLMQRKNITPAQFTEMKKDEQKTTIKEAYEGIYNLYANDLARYNTAMTQYAPTTTAYKQAEQLKKVIEKVINSFPEVVDKHADYLRQYGIKITRSEASIEEEVDELRDAEEYGDTEDSTEEGEESVDKEIGDDGNPYIARNEVNTVEFLSANTKLLIASAIEMQLVDQGNGVSKPFPVMNELRRTKVVNFKDTYNLISYTLKGLTTEQEMWRALNEAAIKTPSLYSILGKLGDPANIPTMDINKASMWRDFKVDFSKTYSEGTTTMVDPETGNIYQVSNNVQNLRERLIEKFRTNLLKSVYTTEVGGVLTLDKEVANEGNPVIFLKKLGIEFEGYNDEEAKALLDTLFKGDVSLFIGNLKKDILEHKGPIDNIFSASFKHASDFNRIVDALSERTKSVVELSYRNAEGKRIYAITQHNYLSLIVDALNNSKTFGEFKEKHPHLFNTYNKNSVWLNSIFPENEQGVRVKAEGVKINLNTVSGLKQVKGDGTNTTSLHFADKIAQEINDLLRVGSTSLPRASDKSTEYAINVTYPNKKYLIERVEDTASINKVFMGYFMDEVNRIRAYRLEGKGKDIKTYGTDKKDKNGKLIPGSANANNFSIFEGIIKEDTLASLEAQGLFNGEALYDDDAEGNDSPKKLVLRDINNFIKNELFGKEVAAIKEIGIGKPWSKTAWINGEKTLVSGIYGMSNELFTTKNPENEVDNLLKLFVLNHFIETIEHHKVLIGDPALYADKFKRISAFTGNKDYVNTGLLTEWVNSHREFKTYIDENGEEVDWEYKDTDNMKVSVIADVKAISGMLGEYSKAVDASKLGEYSKMTEADAQGLIDIIAYKRLAFKAKRWTTAQENQYKYEMIWEKKHWRGEDLTVEEQKIYNDGEQGVFPILKGQYAGPQAYDGDLNLQSFHKYSLAPIFPRLVDGTPMGDKLKQMRAKQIGYIVFDSGSKVGTKLGKDGSQHDFFKDTEFRDDHIQVINNQYLGIQVDIAPKVKEKVIFGTQFRKLIESNLFANGLAQVEGFDELHKEYKGLIEQLVKNEWDKLRKELDITTDNVGVASINKTKLVKLIREEAISRNLSDNVVESVETTTSVTGEVILKYQLDSLVNRNKIEGLLLSLVNSRIIRQTMPGDAMVQMATTGFQKASKDETGKLLTYRKEVNHMSKEDKLELFTLLRSSLIDAVRDTPEYEKYNGNTLGVGSFNDDMFDLLLTGLKDNKVDTSEIHSKINARLKELTEQGISEDGGFNPSTGEFSKFMSQEDKDSAVNAVARQAELLKKYKENNTLPSQCKVSLNAQYLPLLDLYGSLDAVNQAIKDGKIDKRILRMVGYRIPTQGMNSIENLEIVEFLPPSTMNAIILPSEIVAKSGGDFDIDKLNIFRPNFSIELPIDRVTFINDSIKKIAVSDVEYAQYVGRLTQEELDRILDLKDIPAKGSFEELVLASNNAYEKKATKEGKATYKEYKGKNNKKAIQNRIIEIASEIISHPHNYELLVTPNSVDTLKAIVEEIRKRKGISVTPPNQTDQLRFSHIMDQFKYFLGGKGGVGPAAIHNTFHTLFQQAGTALNVDIWMPVNKNGDKVSLGDIKDVNGKHYISDIISQFINAYVDVARDPFYKDLNAGIEAESIYFYLIHMGADIETISYFLTQPSVMELVEAESMNSSILKETYGQDKRRHEVVQGIFGKYAKRYNILAEKLELPARKVDDMSDWTELFTQVDNKTLLDNMSKGFKKGKVVDVNSIDDIDYVLAQIQYLINFEDYKKGADELTKLTRTLNYDTAKMKDLAAIEMYNDVVNEIGGEDSIFTKKDREDILNATIVGSFSLHDKVSDMFSPLFLTEKEFKGARKKMIKMLDPKMTSKDKAKAYTLINNDFINYITQKFYVQGDGPLYNQISPLFVGENSVARRLPDIKNMPSVKGNFLLEQLQSLLSQDINDINNISIFSKKYTVEESNSLTVSFRELLENKEPIIVDFAKDLVKFGILQSGLNNSPITYLGLIPHEKYGEITNIAVEGYSKQTPEEKESLFNDFFLRFILKNIDKPFVVPYAKRSPEGRINPQLLKHIAITEKVGNEYVVLFKVVGQDGKPTWAKHSDLPGLTNLKLARHGYKLQNFYLSDAPILNMRLLGKGKPSNGNSTPTVDNSPVTSMGDYTNHSGGAEGADAMFDIIGRAFGVTKHNHYREPGTTGVDSKTLTANGIGSANISEEDYTEGQTKATIAARQMGRITDVQQSRSNYIIRNWAQVKYSSGVYAVSSIIEAGTDLGNGKTAKIKQVSGGTGYAVQMAINEKKDVYVFDQTTNKWFTYDYKYNDYVPLIGTPELTKNFAGIGTRKINDAGKNAIKSLYEKAASKFPKEEVLPVNNTQVTEKVDKTADTSGSNPSIPVSNTTIIKGVDSVFAENSELSKIGNASEYSQYLASIFPNSKVKGVLYHGSLSKDIDSLKVGDDIKGFGKSLKGIYLTDDRGAASYYASTEEMVYDDETGESYSQPKLVGKVYSVIINSNTPLTVEDRGQVSENSVDKNKYDSILIKPTNKDLTIAESMTLPQGYIPNEYVAFNSEQTHILGSNKDIEGFKKWKQSNKRVNGKEVVVAPNSSENNLPIFETEDKVFLMNDGQQETYGFIKDKVFELLKEGQRYHVEDLKKGVVFEDGLASQYSGLIPQIMWDKMIGLGGRGGTGKTTVIKKILGDIEKEYKAINKYAGLKIRFIGPTHTAATVLQESLGIDSESTTGIVSTLASFTKRSKENGRDGLDLIDEQSYIDSKKFDDKISDVDILIFDESSMYSREQVQDILLRLEQEYRADNFDYENQVYYPNPSPRKMPIMLFMGDYRQLGPVEPGKDKGGMVNKGPIAATLLVNKDKAKELTQVMRSNDALLHKIFDSVGNPIIHNMNKVKAHEAPDQLDLKNYDSLTNKSTENILVVTDTEGVVDDYTNYLIENNNPYGMFWIHYNKLTNPKTEELAQKIRNKYFNKLYRKGVITKDDIVAKEHRRYFKQDYIQYNGGLEIPTHKTKVPEGKWYAPLLKELYKSETFIQEGYLKPQSRYKVLDIYDSTESILGMLPPESHRFLTNKGFMMDVEVSVLYNRQDRIRAVKPPMNLIVTDEYIEEGKYKGRRITFTNKRTGETSQMNLSYRDYKQLKIADYVAQLSTKTAITSKFRESYIGSSHTAQGNSIKNVIAGVYNVKENLKAGINQDDGFASLYTILTRTSGKLVLIENRDIENNQEVFTGFINDKKSITATPEIVKVDAVEQKIESLKSVGTPTEVIAKKLDVPVEQVEDENDGLDTTGNTSDFNFVDPVNIYSGDKNGYESLSNFNNGPITLNIQGKDVVFKTVEHLYQFYKANISGDRVAANKIYNAPTGYDAWKEGRGVKLDESKWTKEVAAKYLEASMRKAFEQNTSARELLIKTGESPITHKKDGKDMDARFVTNLTKIREELKATVTKPSETGSISDDVKRQLNAFYTYLKEAYGVDKVSPDKYKEAVYGGLAANMTPKQIKELIEEKIVSCGKL